MFAIQIGMFVFAFIAFVMNVFLFIYFGRKGDNESGVAASLEASIWFVALCVLIK